MRMLLVAAVRYVSDSYFAAIEWMPAQSKPSLMYQQPPRAPP